MLIEEQKGEFKMVEDDKRAKERVAGWWRKIKGDKPPKKKRVRGSMSHWKKCAKCGRGIKLPYDRYQSSIDTGVEYCKRCAKINREK